MLLRRAASGGFFRANACFLASVGFSEEELAREPFLHWVEPASVDTATATPEGLQPSCTVEHRTRAGEPVSLSIRCVQQDGQTMVLARLPERTEGIEGPDDADDEATVAGTLHTIARIVEAQNPGYRCSILLVADGRFVRGAGPSLPEEYNAAIDGFAIGPTVGSCGTAIYWNVPVIVADIQADPLWVPFAELAKQAGVAACWSHPFTGRTGTVLGALALYSPEPRVPTAEQLSRLEAAARMTGLAVERGRAQESLQRKRKRELELEEQLRQAAKMEALGVLAGGIAHDFNNVLATILANAELSAELLPANSEVQEMLADIVEASARAGQFCQRMLDYAGRGSLDCSTFEIGKLMPEISNLVRPALPKKTTLEYALLERPIHVEGDESQLLQVLMNLVTNAAEAIGEGEGRILVSSELVRYDEGDLAALEPLCALPPGEYVRLSVAGMDSDTAALIFDPFYSTKATGHGLGLSAVKGIVKRHGGVIRIESEVGSGTTISVVLPTVKEPTTGAAVASPQALATGPQCVLVAEDEAPLRAILSRRLKRAGFQVLAAADGQDAVDLFLQHSASIDCVLVDLNMPTLDGEETQRAIHAIRADVPIIVMSGYSEQEVVDRFRDAGIAGCLQKPVPSAVLIETIRGAILASG